MKHYPAGYQVNNVLTVTGTSITRGNVWWDPNNAEYLPFTPEYKVDYGRASVDIAAPSSDIISTWAPGSAMCRVRPPPPPPSRVHCGCWGLVYWRRY